MRWTEQSTVIMGTKWDLTLKPGAFINHHVPGRDNLNIYCAFGFSQGDQAMHL